MTSYIFSAIHVRTYSLEEFQAVSGFLVDLVNFHTHC